MRSNTKLGVVADRPGSCAIIQTDLDSMEKWANRYLMKFNKEKCRVLHLVIHHVMHWYRLGLENRRIWGSPQGKLDIR